MKRINIYSVKQVKEKGGLYDLDSVTISSPDTVPHVLRTVLDLHNEAVEKFGIINLNTKNKITGIHIVSVGSLNASIVHPREVFKQAILNNAASIICFHNHPSGNPDPSIEDIKVTERLRDAGKLIGIELLDHIIVGDDTRFISLKEKGML